METIPYDQRSGKIWFNGKLVDWNNANIHVLNHGLHYASCVFEGERVYEGEIFKLQEHTQRLFHSLKEWVLICHTTKKLLMMLLTKLSEFKKLKMVMYDQLYGEEVK